LMTEIDNFMACGGKAPNLYCAPVSTGGRTTPAYSDDCHDIR
jgi:hypothetical protein